MELWEKSDREKALLYKLPETDQDVFRQWAFDQFQGSPLGWVRIGRTVYHSTRTLGVTALTRLGYVKAKDQSPLDPRGDIRTL